MAETYESWYRSTLAAKLNAADTSMIVATAPTVTRGRLYLRRWATEEWIEFTWVSGSTLTWLTRGLSQTADPVTWWTGETWVAWTEVELVAMHDQLQDKARPAATTFADTTARDASLWGDWVATQPYTDVYTTAEWLHWNYNLSSNQWESVDTWTTTPNASETAAGKVEEATQTQNDDGDTTDTTWAPLFWTPQKIGRSVQKQSYSHAVDTWAADAYVITLSPAPTAYSDGMRVSIEISNTNTWASTLNVNALWVVWLKNNDWNDFSIGQLVAWRKFDFIYEWTEFRSSTQIIKRLWWDGSDWALSISSWTTTLTLVDSFVEKNYSSVSISWTALLDVTWVNSSIGWVAFIKCAWDFTMSAWTIDISGQWWAGWAGWTWSWDGSDGTQWRNSSGLTHYWSAWTDSTWTNATWGTWILWPTSLNDLWNSLSFFTWGWGGWWEWNTTWWNGWRWGWLLIIEVWWAFNFTWWTIQSNWSDGANSGGWGGWGWGWGWSIIVVYNSLTSNSGTLQCNWWDWWDWTWVTTEWGWGWGWYSDWGDGSDGWTWSNWTSNSFGTWGTGGTNNWWGWGWAWLHIVKDINDL